MALTQLQYEVINELATAMEWEIGSSPYRAMTQALKMYRPSSAKAYNNSDLLLALQYYNRIKLHNVEKHLGDK